MTRRLPSLNALRAFEAAGRNLSLTKAAEELHVTPAAVGHQVKALEEYLGVKLFRRQNRGLLLTDNGQVLLPELGEGLDRLESAVQRVQARPGSRTFTVTTSQSFASKWLVPRLDRFHAAHPEIDLRIDASPRLVDFQREEVDLGIRWGAGGWSGLYEERLFDETVFPVCSPKLLSGEHPLRTLDDLRWHTLLHVDPFSPTEGWIDWQMWLAAAGATGIDATRGPRFSLLALAVQAALEGHGIALGRSVLVADDLAAGRLVRPFTGSVPSDFAYFLVGLDRSLQRPCVTVFREWLLQEIANDRDAQVSAIGEL